jgi:hypothetical protein
MTRRERTWQDMRDSAQVRSTLSSVVVRETTKDMLQVFMTASSGCHRKAVLPSNIKALNDLAH